VLQAKDDLRVTGSKQSVFQNVAAKHAEHAAGFEQTCFTVPDKFCAGKQGSDSSNNTV
jgi:hypothetical protein